MRLANILAASVATAALCAGSAAYAASNEPVNLLSDGTVAQSGDSTDFTAQDQSDSSAALFGVRGRLSVAAAPVSGTGSFDAINPGRTSSTSPTPDQPCTVGQNGWCNTAIGIATSAFGWDGHAKGAGVIIGIVDTGIDLTTPDFQGRILTGGCITSGVNPCTSANDQVGGDLTVFPGANSTHGTHVAGIAAGAQTGIAPLADILPVKVCSSTADSCAGVDQGIVYASQHGARVINVSIGGPILTASDVTSFKMAIANGSLLVVAAGNSGTKDPSSGFLAGAALQDGVRGSMIVVGATGAGGSGGHGQVTTFSQVPSTQCEVHSGARFCLENYFVVAPGGNIWSTVGNGTSTAANYNYLSGTSMATPYVTGVAAVIMGNSPSLTASQVASIIFQTTDDLGAPGPDPVYGMGAVDITKALAPVGSSIVLKGSSNNALPTNMSQITAAVNGGQASAQTLSQFGVAGANAALVSGPLSVAIQNSTLLKNTVVVDSFGRTFTANMTKTAFTAPMVDLVNFMQSSFYTSYSGFGGAVDTPLGLVSASGYTVTTTTPKLVSSEYTDSDRVRTSLRDFSMSLDVVQGVSLDMGYNARMAGRFNSYDAASSPAYDGLFFSASALNSPYVSLTDGGNYVGSSVQLTDDLRFSFGASSMTPQTAEFEVAAYPMIAQLNGNPVQYDQRRANSSMAGVTWDATRWAGFGMTVSDTTEYDGLLGGISSGAMNIDSQAHTTAVGFNGRIGFGDGWVSMASYNQGVTHLGLQANSLVDGADTLHSSSYGMGIAKFGVFEDADSIGLAMTRPIHVTQGGVDLTAATGVDEDGNVTMGHEHVSLSSATPETDLEAGYMTSYLNGRLSLQANAAYQMNVDGRTGTNAVTGLARVQFNF
jgi:subtilisin family serine protease